MNAPEEKDAADQPETVRLTLSEVTHSVFYAPQYVAPITPTSVASADNSVDEEISLANVDDADTETLGLGDDIPNDVPF